MRRLFPVLFALFFASLYSPYHGEVAEAGEPTLTVRVIHDLNENGVWDPGEAGLEGWSALGVCGDVVEWSGTTDAAGQFIVPIHSVPFHSCVRFAVEFGWFAVTPARFTVYTESTEPLEAVLLVRKVGQDIAGFTGRLIVDGMPASPDTELEALVGSQRCGDAQIEQQDGITSYTLYVLPASELPGCAVDGGEVAFAVDGVEVHQSPFTPLAMADLDIVLGASPMYFHYKNFASDVRGLVTPRIGSHDCGSGFLITDLGPFFHGWQDVYIPAAETLSHCGSVGAAVSLWYGDRVVDQVMWEPGLADQPAWRRLGDASCDAKIDSRDAAVVLQYVAGLLTDISCSGAADVNQDGEVNVVDVALMLQHVAEIIPWFPTE